MPLPHDYAERVYAGVLGKIIGVYLGRPFEGWTYDRIMQELGEVWYYVHEKRKTPLIVTDDDISGTFTFLRALPDYGNARDLSPAQIGQTWLNYIIERRTILWWGGLGNSTEHTAFLRLKRGIPAPESGSIARNGQVVAEQIGSQIFIDGWAMVAPGDPELAADLARRAASVSHDGEAIYGAQVLAAMEAQAFVERDLNALIDTAVGLIPRDSVIARMINDIREWHAEFPDWHQARDQIVAHYGYDKFGGNCHMVPNHALIHLGLLYGEDDFQKSLMITNTAGWDTDCNSGNVGCLLGIKNGLAGIDAGPDWRGPVADRLYLPTADGGRCVTDAAREAYQVVNVGRALAGEPPVAPKGGARFHFELPGSVQGWMADASVESKGALTIENVAGHSAQGARSLALRARGLAPGRVARATTATFIPPDAKDMPGYSLLASPTLYPGQTVRADVEADAGNGSPLVCRLLVQSYGAEDRLRTTYGPQATLEAGARHSFAWRVPDMGGQPIAAVGLEIAGAPRGEGTVYLDAVTWDGAPDTVFRRPQEGGTLWRRAWVDAVDQYDRWYAETYRLVQNDGVGLLSQGTREWTDYRAEAEVTPHMVASCGIAARVQGLRRYVALTLGRDAQGRKVLRLRARVGERDTGVEAPCEWELGCAYRLRLEVQGASARGQVDDGPALELRDVPAALAGGGVALLCEEGRAAFEEVTVRPLS
jgi:ADP-ribosylglycohydrolase